MAVFAVCGSPGIRPPVFCVKSEAPLLRAQKRRWRVACVAGADSLSEWRRECGELRVQVHELRGALADARMQDDILLLELDRLVTSLVARAPVQARDGEVSATSSVTVSIEDEDAEPDREDREDEDEVYKDAVMVSELRSKEIRSKQEGLSTMRRLKTLNVHEYVHNALRESHLRSWLKSRGIAE